MISYDDVKHRLDFSTKLYYGLASLGTATLSSIFAALLPIFYQDYLGLSVCWIGIAAFVYAAWNAINDPLFGFITDNTRSKYGRRIPYMRFTAPFLALTFILVWLAPEGAGEPIIFWWMLGTMLLYDTAYTIIGLVYGALMPELTESDVERNQLSISTALFGLLGYFLGFLIPDFFRHQVANGEPYLVNLRLAMVAVAIISAFLIILTTLKIKERREFTMVDSPLKFWESLRWTFTSKPFWIFAAMNFLLTLVTAMAIGSLFYLADYVTQTSVFILVISLFIPVAIGIPMGNLVVKRFGLLRAQQYYLLVGAVGLILLAFIPINLVPVSLVIAGLGLSGQQTITYNILAQVIDEDEVRTGVRREGAFYGANALITKPAQSLALFLTAFILEQTGFIPRAMSLGQGLLDQPASALFGIRSIVGLIPGLGMLLGALILCFYPLHGERLVALKAKIMDMHAEKESKLADIEGAQQAGV
jgi:glycoside/pentoside/hexuronide:cation symporter, GPH family